MEDKIRVIDELENRVGGRFMLTALLQKRIREIVAGAPRLVEIRSDNPIDVAIAEIRAGKIDLVPEDAE
jgi:DNA-directed RNA polymerase subunit K/omega